MAKQAGPIYFIGTIDDLTFYKQGDQYYVKRTSTCSETTKKKYRTQPGYALLRLRRGQFGFAAKLVKPIYYRHLPRAARKHKLFGKLTGMVNSWLQAGKSEEEARELLIVHCAQLAAAAVTEPEAFVAEPPVALNVAPREDGGKEGHTGREEKKTQSHQAVQSAGSQRNEGAKEQRRTVLPSREHELLAFGRKQDAGPLRGMADG